MYADPADTIFWYGFGQGAVHFIGGVNTAISSFLSDMFCHAWDAVTGQYTLVLHSEAEYSNEDIDAMRRAGLSEKDIDAITGNATDISENTLKQIANSDPSAVNQTTANALRGNEKPVSGESVVIPQNPDQGVRIDYELSYYVNDINTSNEQVLMTYGRNESEKSVYTYGIDRIAEDDLQTEETSNYLYDGRGSVVQTVVAGEIDLSITYDPFGDIISGVDANFVGFAYNGEETNQVTGLQYLRARYYDSDLGSFLTIDSYLGSLTDVTSQNRYTYANNDPVNNIDPSGHYSTNVNGTMQYYQSTGLNELRDYMTAAGFRAGQVQAQNSFNASVYRAQNTSFMNYQSISGISQATANSYVYNGIAKAGQVSMNYGCAVPTVPYAAVNRFESNVNAAKNSANAQISQIKAQKKTQYDQYQAYLEYLRQLEIARQRALEAAKALKNGFSKFTSGVSSFLDKLFHPYCTCSYSGSAADFRRLEQNLPPLGCTCGKPKKPIVNLPISSSDKNAGLKITKYSGKEYYDYTDVVMNRINEVLPDFYNHNIITYEEYIDKYSLKLFGKWTISIPEYDEYVSYVLGNLWFFYDEVNHNKPWDIKRDTPWKQQFGNIRMPYYDGKPENSEVFLFRNTLVTREDLGNITYGYLGSAMGIGDITLYWGGGVAAQGKWKILSDVVRDVSQYYGDSKEDHEAIKKGIDWYYEDYPNAKPGINRTIP